MSLYQLFAFFHHLLLDKVYIKTNVNRACCEREREYDGVREKGRLHRTCRCDFKDSANVLEGYWKMVCEGFCTGDPGCKGYVIHTKPGTTEKECQLATSSPCPDKTCTVHNKFNNLPLNPNGECGTKGEWNGGCAVKKLSKCCLAK